MHKINANSLILRATASKDEIIFAQTCINNNVSLLFAGETGSGKTASLVSILENVPDDPRELIRLASGNTPEILILDEIGGDKAVEVVKAVNAGRTSGSTVHADSAILAYKKIARLCHTSEPWLSETRHLKDIIEAFPIVIFLKKLKDKRHKWMQIFEATGIKDGKVSGNVIFGFEQMSFKLDENKKIKEIYGKHMQKNPISEKLAKRLARNRVDPELIRKWRLKTDM